MTQIIQAPQIIRDIDPYRAVAVDVRTGDAPVISSRREHREFLKRNSYVEIGNDIPAATKKPIETVSGHEIKRVIEEVKSR